MNLKEMDNFRTLLRYVHMHRNTVLRLETNNETILAYYDTDYEDDNDLEMDDPNYEEFQSIVFTRVDGGGLFQINYHTLPKKVMDGETVVISEK